MKKEVGVATIDPVRVREKDEVGVTIEDALDA